MGVSPNSSLALQFEGIANVDSSRWEKRKKNRFFFCKFIFISLLLHSLPVLCQIPPALGFVSKQAM